MVGCHEHLPGTLRNSSLCMWSQKPPEAVSEVEIFLWGGGGGGGGGRAYVPRTPLLGYLIAHKHFFYPL